MNHEQLMWLGIGIWLLFIVVLIYAWFFEKPAQALPSGNTAVVP
jgi:hypothetical protein